MDRDAADDQAAADYRKAHTEADRLGAVAQGTKFRMLLVIDDPGLRELADVALRHADILYSAEDKTKVEALEVEFEEHMSVFVARAAQLLR